MDKMKNISKAEVLVLKDQVAYQEGQVCEPHTCTECGSECYPFLI